MSAPLGYRWGTDTVASYSSLTHTTKFDDVGIRDATTGESASASNVFVAAGCAYRAAVAIVVGMCDFGQKATLDTFAFTVRGYSPSPGPQESCFLLEDSDPAPTDTATPLLQWMDCATGAWNTVAPGAGVANGGVAGYFDYTGSFPLGISCRYVRLVMTQTSWSGYQTTGAVNAAAIISDYRISGTPLPILPPTGLAGSGVCEGAQATLTWNLVSNAARYNVYKDGVLYAAGVTATTKVVTGLTLGVAYSFTVSSVDACGFESAQSAPVVITPCATISGWGTDPLPPPLSPDEWTDDCLWSTQTGWADDAGLPF